MKKGLGRLAALALALTVLLTACTQTGEDPAGFDAETYVNGVLKATYLGEFDQAYLDMVGITHTEAHTEYEDGILMEVSNFYNAYGIETSTTELQQEIEELFHEIYSHASLTVTETEEGEDGSFVVTVEVEPIDIVQQVHTDLPALQEKFLANYPESVQNTMSTQEYAAFDAAWAELVVGLYQEKLETIGHLPARTVKLRVEQDSRGYYGIKDADFLALDRIVIDYFIPESLLPGSHDHDHEGEGEPEGSPTPEESDPPKESGEPQESPAPEEGEAVQTGGQPPETSEPPQESQEPPASETPQESQDPNVPTPPTTGTPVPGLEPE